MKIKNLFLIVIFLMIFSFGIITEKALAEEQNITTPTKELSGDSGVEKTNATTSQKPSPYSLIKERIQELQQKMKTNTERKDGQSTTTKAEMNARKQPLINVVEDKNKIDEQKEKVEEKKQEIQNKKEEVKQKLTDNSIKRVRAYTEKIVNRFMAAIERFETLSKRIGSRIQKIEEDGIKLDEAKTKLKDANEKIASAKTKVSDIVTKIEEVLASEAPKEMFGQSKEIFKTVENIIKEIHKSLVKVITIVKSSEPDSSDTNPEATTTKTAE